MFTPQHVVTDAGWEGGWAQSSPRPLLPHLPQLLPASGAPRGQAQDRASWKEGGRGRRGWGLVGEWEWASRFSRANPAQRGEVGTGLCPCGPSDPADG